MIDGKFQFSTVLETLARDKIAVYIDVWDSHAALAFSRYENGVIITKYVEGEELYAWKIIEAVRGRDAQAIALFANQIKA